MTERELIARARAGDEDAFEEIVRAHSDRVYGALRRFGLAPDDAGEVAQEVFLRAWRGLAGFEGRAQLSTWLYRIAFNEAQRRLARREPATVAPDEEISDAVAHGPAAQALEHEFTTALQTALLELPVQWRVAVVLRDIEGVSTRDAAAIIGTGEAAFKSRLHRGRMQLRTLLQPYLQGSA